MAAVRIDWEVSLRNAFVCHLSILHCILLHPALFFTLNGHTSMYIIDHTYPRQTDRAREKGSRPEATKARAQA